MAEHDIGSRDTGSNIESLSVPPGDDEQNAGGQLGGQAQPGDSDMNMHATIKAAATPDIAWGEWEAALQPLQLARAAYVSYEGEWEAVYVAHQATEPSMAMINWREFPGQDRFDVALRINTDEVWQAFLRGEGRTWWAVDAAARKATLRAALDTVEEYRRLRAENDALHDWTAANQRLESLDSEVAAAESALLKLPAPHLDALLWKIETIARTDGDTMEEWYMDLVRPMVADARRLIAGEP